MDRLLSSDAYLNLRFRLGFEILFGHLIRSILLVLALKFVIKFIYSEETTKFCKIFTLLLSYVVPVKSKVKILHNFVAFSDYMNFKTATH